jgi:protein-export membrane protein SecD
MSQSQRSSIKKVTWSQIKTRVGLLAVLLVLCIVVVVPGRVNQVINSINQKANIGVPRLPDKGFNLGLDLQGGAHLVYHAKTDQLAASDRADAVQGVRDVIERRVRGGLGVSEPLVQTTQVGGDYRIIVELPGVTDVNQAIAMIGATPILEFKEQNDQPQRSLTPEEQKQLNEYNTTAQKKAEEALADAKKGTDFTTLFQKYSQPSTSTGETSTSSVDLGFVDERQYPELYQWAQAHKDGEVSTDLVRTQKDLNIVKLLGSQDGDEVVSADHILICYKGSTGCSATTTKEEALQKIQDIRKQATSQNFTELAKKYSTDPTAQQNGGDLGSFRRGAMVQPFDDTVWKMATNTISDPILTDFGYHIIYKKNEFKMKKYHIERIAIATRTAQDILPPDDEWKSTGLSGKNLKKAEVVQDPQTGVIQVSLNFDEEGSKLFANLTGRNIGKRIAIFLDGKILTAPNVDRAITEGRAVITGGFDVTGARALAQNLNAGALPVPVELLSQQKVDATLGAASLNTSFMAGVYGLIAIMLFMILYYRLPGLLSVVSLAFYAILSLAVFKVAGVTLTLSGIAGFILSIGMAVDANILVFERLKEELRAGKSFHASLEESFIRSWPSIRDGHITALISCVFLMWFGSGFVQGFAVILALGTIINLFTSITITRTFMRFCFKKVGEKANVLFLGYTKSNE